MSFPGFELVYILSSYLICEIFNNVTNKIKLILTSLNFIKQLQFHLIKFLILFQIFLKVYKSYHLVEF